VIGAALATAKLDGRAVSYQHLPVIGDVFMRSVGDELVVVDKEWSGRFNGHYGI
jgi:hypothetical protein